GLALLKRDTAALNDLIKKQTPADQTQFLIKLTQLTNLQEGIAKQIFENSSHKTTIHKTKLFEAEVYLCLLFSNICFAIAFCRFVSWVSFIKNCVWSAGVCFLIRSFNAAVSLFNRMDCKLWVSSSAPF